MVGKFSYLLTIDAEQDYIEAFTWYEDQLEGLGERFAAAVREKLKQITLHPYLYSNKKAKYHETKLDKPFPFIIVYVIEAEQQSIIITSVFHTSRNRSGKYRK